MMKSYIQNDVLVGIENVRRFYIWESLKFASICFYVAEWSIAGSASELTRERRARDWIKTLADDNARRLSLDVVRYYV